MPITTDLNIKPTVLFLCVRKGIKTEAYRNWISLFKFVSFLPALLPNRCNISGKNEAEIEIIEMKISERKRELTTLLAENVFRGIYFTQ